MEMGQRDRGIPSVFTRAHVVAEQAVFCVRMTNLRLLAGPLQICDCKL